MDEVAFPAIDRAKRRFLKQPSEGDAGALLRSLYQALDADLAGRYAPPVIDLPALETSYAELLVLLDAPITLPELESR
ncbi:hypothetical protein SPRG_16195 [Saprolegnia parasitica CBS 223.65]|uniref:Uncharacterized protein n=1 Tax=Saprolegnia parasitica (strain CBS 223.65) TaxID=695850 RepID=A0A067BVV0_SAPPC|nr:hypothetical protein SPRG_16195 [Saprolegnia parasitica CBS 223.65]KDO18426.1 hypothetical protein SPRG_16195 [Saprolegnia parasitica CBS 223.65]|eukprot:XP_012210856.1 hypothetical protein SPRG_16195 [Saprolegnia parasitica CBS 223.65]